MILNETSSNYSDMDCESQANLAKIFVCIMSGLLPAVMFLVMLLNAIYDQQKRRGKVLEKSGAIVFTDCDFFELVGSLKVIYCTVFSLIFLYLILVVVIMFVNNKCLDTIPFFPVVPVFTFCGFLGYFFYYADQSIVSNIRCLRGPDQNTISPEKSHLPDSSDCKSYVRMLLQTNPKIFFKYIEYHLGGFDEEVVDVDINKEFIYTRCDDVTCPKQLEDVESKIDLKKPVILETIIKIVCGDDITKTKFSHAWSNFASISNNRIAQNSKCFRQVVINEYKQEVMRYWGKTHAIPWWMSVKWYRIFTSLLLAVPYRIVFGYASQRVRVRIQKVIYC
ncbi:uncharacterized protein LOC134275682 [Saccostrea cucullata]|uniref:uncharacterized protein LOC134275682 n=1 Tax=Saccostrea cuccullata TaxID=36930 RepID=UPI002ED0D15C